MSWRFLRRAMNWAAVLWAGPNSVLGLLLVPLGLLPGGTIRVRDGVIECVAGALPRPARALGDRIGIEVLTLGHVVVAGSRSLMSSSRKHERVHVRQYERYGPLFLPLYLLSSIAALARGRHPYSHNRFEREARLRPGHQARQQEGSREQEDQEVVGPPARSGAPDCEAGHGR